MKVEQVEPVVPMDDDHWYLAVWFVGGPHCNRDWFATVYRKRAALNDWELTYRIRYIKDKITDPFLTQDTKRAFTVQAAGKTEAEMLRVGDQMAEIASEDLGCPSDRVVIRGDAKRLVKRMKTRSWAHFRTMNPQ
jgi:hypothetical protein